MRSINETKDWWKGFGKSIIWHQAIGASGVSWNSSEETLLSKRINCAKHRSLSQSQMRYHSWFHWEYPVKMKMYENANWFENISENQKSAYSFHIQRGQATSTSRVYYYQIRVQGASDVRTGAFLHTHSRWSLREWPLMITRKMITDASLCGYRINPILYAAPRAIGNDENKRSWYQKNWVRLPMATT